MVFLLFASWILWLEVHSACEYKINRNYVIAKIIEKNEKKEEEGRKYGYLLGSISLKLMQSDFSLY